MFQIFALVLALLNLVACGKSPDSKRGRYNVAIYENDLNVLELSQDWKVQCRDSSQCPNTVAQVLMASGRTAGVCTATLISDDRAITNSHCFDFNPSVSPDLICQAGTVLIFASNSPSGREVVECESIIKKSRIGADGSGNFRNPDYMILKLKKSLSRGFEILDNRGLEEGLFLTIKKVNPVRKNLGELVVELCETLFSTILMPNANHIFSPVHTMSRCDVMAGNSGSSLFDSSGKIRGLIFAGLTDESFKRLEKSVPRSVLNQLIQVKPSLATNGACIETIDGQLRPRECLKGRTEAEQKIDPKTLEGYDLIEQQMAVVPSNPNFGYALKDGEVRPDLSGILFYGPSCFKSPAKLGGHYLDVLNWNVSLKVSRRLKLSIEPGQPQIKSCWFYAFGAYGNSVELRTSTQGCLLEGEREIIPPCSSGLTN